MGIIPNFLGAQDLNSESKSLITRYFSLNVGMKTLSLITSTFYILFIIDLVGYTTLGILISVGFLVQSFIDYPTGVIADWLGYRWVMFASYFAHAVAFLMLGLSTSLNISNLLTYLVIVYIIESFALAQESGATQSWFDNNYKLTAGDDDPNRVVYRDIYGKTLMILRLLGGIGIFVGGFLSDAFDRETVFLVQAAFMLLMAFAFLVYMSDFGEHETPEISVSSYINMMKQGVSLIFNDRMLKYFTGSFILIILVNYIWVSLIVYPMYFGFTGSDSLASSLRSILFIVGAVMTGIGTRLCRDMDVKIWLPRIFLIWSVFYYGFYATIIAIFELSPDPAQASLNIPALVFVFLAALIGNLSTTIGMLLVQRFMVDAIPDENRNSFYSLSPTLGLLISSAMVIIAGTFVDATQNFSLTIIFFISIPLLLAYLLSKKAMSLYQPTDRVIHHHATLLTDTNFFQLEEIFWNALPDNLALNLDTKQAWQEFVEEVLHHGGTEDHEFLDTILNDLIEYQKKFETILNAGEMSSIDHESLSLLRKKLIADAEDLGITHHELTVEEESKLKILIDILHQHEHEIGEANSE